MQQVQINLAFVIKAVVKYWKVFITTNALVLVTATIIAFLLPKYYESKVIFYPYSPEATDPRSFLYKEKVDVYIFSYVDQSDRYILSCHTKQVLDTITKVYDMMRRYKVNKENPRELMQYYADLSANIQVKKGENGAVILTVLDQNPDTAAIIANKIVDLVKGMEKQKMQARNRKIFDIYEQHYIKMNAYVNGLKDSVNNVRKRKTSTMKDEVALLNQVEYAMEEFTKVKFQYEQAKSLMTHELESIYLIEPAQPNPKKAKPKRLYIIAGSLLLSALLSTIAISVFEYVKKSVKN